MRSICVDSFMFENGERYCHIVNKDTGEPLYYPNLYITTPVSYTHLDVYKRQLEYFINKNSHLLNIPISELGSF